MAVTMTGAPGARGGIRLMPLRMRRPTRWSLGRLVLRVHRCLVDALQRVVEVRGLQASHISGILGPMGGNGVVPPSEHRVRPW